MKLRKLQAGFSAFELVIVIAAVGIIALIGYNVYQRQKPDTTTTSSLSSTSDQPQAAAINVPAAPTVKTASDLDKASATLDQINVDSDANSDLSQLNSELAAF